MNTVAKDKKDVEFLGAIPAFANCATEVLEEFVAQGACEMHYDAGETLCSHTQCDENLYVLVSGSATLDAGDGVKVALEPGDYFGRNPGGYHELIAAVTADEDVDVLVVQAQELLVLERASSRSRHPSQVEWRSEFATPASRNARRHLRALVAS